MALGADRNLGSRREELESLLYGLPPTVLKAALELAVSRLEEKNRPTIRTRLGQCKTQQDGIRTILAAIGQLDRKVQDDIAATIIEIAARASLGSDD